MTTKIKDLKSPRIIYELEWVVLRIENRDWQSNAEYYRLLKYKQDLENEIDKRLSQIL